MNLQREIVYEYRNDVLGTGDMRRLVHEIISECATAKVEQHLSDFDPNDPDYTSLLSWLQNGLNVEVSEEELASVDPERMDKLIEKKVRESYDSRLQALPGELVDREERMLVISAVDGYWQEHLRDMDELREGVYLRAQGQKDPLVEYKNEAYGLFVSLMGSIKQQALLGLMRFSSAVAAHRGQTA